MANFRNAREDIHMFTFDIPPRCQTYISLLFQHTYSFYKGK